VHLLDYRHQVFELCRGDELVEHLPEVTPLLGILFFLGEAAF